MTTMNIAIDHLYWDERRKAAMTARCNGADVEKALDEFDASWPERARSAETDLAWQMRDTVPARVPQEKPDRAVQRREARLARAREDLAYFDADDPRLEAYR